MKLLVTGSSGFIGQYFLEHLSPSYRVKTFSLQREALDTLDMEGVDAVIHLAALVHQMDGAPWEMYQRANVDYPIALAKRAKEAGVKQFIFMSSVKVYGEMSHTPLTESSPCHPEDDYGRSKLLAEEALLRLADDNFTVSIIRTPVVYGERVKGNILKLLQLVERLPLLPFGCIDNRRSMVYVGNLCALIERVVQRCAGGIFLASDVQPFSTTQLIRWIALALERRRFHLCLPGMPSVIKRLKPHLYQRLYENFEVDNQMTRVQLGFEEPFTTQEGIQKMVQWYQRNG
jgi:UDP-glucose 4-epimerase